MKGGRTEKGESACKSKRVGGDRERERKLRLRAKFLKFGFPH